MAKFLSFETNIIYIKRLARWLADCGEGNCNASSDSNDGVARQNDFCYYYLAESGAKVWKEIWFTFFESPICHSTYNFAT